MFLYTEVINTINLWEEEKLSLYVQNVSSNSLKSIFILKLVFSRRRLF